MAAYDFEGHIGHQVKQENPCPIDHHAVEKIRFDPFFGETHHGRTQLTDVVVNQHSGQNTKEEKPDIDDRAPAEKSSQRFDCIHHRELRR